MHDSSIHGAQAATCTFHAGCDYGKGSRESGVAASKEECCSLCAGRGSCAAGVFDGQNCWYKVGGDCDCGCGGGCERDCDCAVLCCAVTVLCCAVTVL